MNRMNLDVPVMSPQGADQLRPGETFRQLLERTLTTQADQLKVKLVPQLVVRRVLSALLQSVRAQS